MSKFQNGKPVFMLVDDNIDSARLMTRTLSVAPIPAQVVWIGREGRAARTLADIVENRQQYLPDMLVVDLKSAPSRTARFIEKIGNLMASRDIPIVAIAESLDAPVRNELLEAGAAAVFERRSDLQGFREEMAELTSFWVRDTLTWPIRA